MQEDFGTFDPNLEGSLDTQFSVIAPIARLIHFELPNPVSLVLAILCAAPLLVLVMNAPTLLVTDAPVDLLSRWLSIRSSELPDLLQLMAEGQAVGSLPLALASQFVESPGRAFLLTQTGVAAVLLLPIAYSLSIRLTVIPACLVSVFLVALLVGFPADLNQTLLASVIWVCVVAYVRPIGRSGAGAVFEGICFGVTLWVLYLSAVPLFLVGFAGFIAALLLQERQGLLFSFIALCTFLFVGGVVEAVSIFATGASVVGKPLSSVSFELPGDVGLWLSSVACVFFLLIILSIRTRCERLQTVMVIAGALAGASALIFAGINPYIFLVAIGLVGLTFRAREMWVPQYISAGEAAAIVLAMLMPMTLIAGSVFDVTKKLNTYAAGEQPSELAWLGFSFENSPEIARMILSRDLDPGIIGEAFPLSPADQALLHMEGIMLARTMAKELGTVTLASGLPEPALLDTRFTEFERANAVVTPKFAIDSTSDAARVANQVKLYTAFRKLDPTLQPSAAFDVWVRREN